MRSSEPMPNWPESFSHANLRWRGQFPVDAKSRSRSVRLVMTSRHHVRKSSTDEMRVFRYGTLIRN